MPLFENLSYKYEFDLQENEPERRTHFNMNGFAQCNPNIMAWFRVAAIGQFFVLARKIIRSCSIKLILYFQTDDMKASYNALSVAVGLYLQPLMSEWIKVWLQKLQPILWGEKLYPTMFYKRRLRPSSWAHSCLYTIFSRTGDHYKFHRERYTFNVQE